MSVTYDFTGKNALVTGAGKGIGRDIAKALHRCGAKVYGLSRSAEPLETLKQECPGLHTVVCDVSDWEATKLAVEALGPVDLLVNNAGNAQTQPFLEVTPDAYDRQMDVNLKSVFIISQVVAKGMVERGQGGSIVNISSQASQRALPDHAVYCASKGALDSLSGVMALELGKHKIRVNCVNPTVVMTDLAKKFWTPDKAKPMLDRIPLGQFAELHDVTEPVLFLLSDKAAMVHGATLPIEGGFWAA